MSDLAKSKPRAFQLLPVGDYWYLTNRQSAIGPFLKQEAELQRDRLNAGRGTLLELGDALNQQRPVGRKLRIYRDVKTLTDDPALLASIAAKDRESMSRRPDLLRGQTLMNTAMTFKQIVQAMGVAGQTNANRPMAGTWGPVDPASAARREQADIEAQRVQYNTWARSNINWDFAADAAPVKVVTPPPSNLRVVALQGGPVYVTDGVGAIGPMPTTSTGQQVVDYLRVNRKTLAEYYQEYGGTGLQSFRYFPNWEVIEQSREVATPRAIFEQKAALAPLPKPVVQPPEPPPLQADEVTVVLDGHQLRLETDGLDLGLIDFYLRTYERGEAFERWAVAIRGTLLACSIDFSSVELPFLRAALTVEVKGTSLGTLSTAALFEVAKVGYPKLYLRPEAIPDDVQQFRMAESASPQEAVPTGKRRFWDD